MQGPPAAVIPATTPGVAVHPALAGQPQGMALHPGPLFPVAHPGLIPAWQNQNHHANTPAWGQHPVGVYHRFCFQKQLEYFLDNLIV